MVRRGEHAERAAHQAALPQLRVQRVRVSLRRREHLPGDRIASPLAQPQRGRLEGRLQGLADADGDESSTGVTPVQAWAIGQAILAGLQIYKRLAPGLVTPAVFEHALGLLADLYPEQ